MPALILDSSVTLSLAFEDEFDDFTVRTFEAVRVGGALVPWLWTLEVANILYSGVKRQRMTESDAIRFLELLAGMPIDVVLAENEKAVKVTTKMFALSISHDLTAYDASYLRISLDSGLPLASKDKKLNTAALKAGVQLFV